MSTFKRHIGKLKNTDRKCVVVFMQIPGKEDHALVVDTDALPPLLHEALMGLVDSVEGQQSKDLHSLLSRRIFTETNIDIMNTLHQRRYLQPTPIDNVVMLPMPNTPYPLRDIIQNMNTLKGKDTAMVEEIAQVTHLPEISESPSDIAAGLLVQAELLESDAKSLRERAYSLAPHLAPKTVAPTRVVVSKTAAKPTVKKATAKAATTKTVAAKKTTRAKAQS